VPGPRCCNRAQAQQPAAVTSAAASSIAARRRACDRSASLVPMGARSDPRGLAPFLRPLPAALARAASVCLRAVTCAVMSTPSWSATRRAWAITNTDSGRRSRSAVSRACSCSSPMCSWAASVDRSKPRSRRAVSRTWPRRSSTEISPARSSVRGGASSAGVVPALACDRWMPSTRCRAWFG
jgi:hypothetical protein